MSESFHLSGESAAMGQESAMTNVNASFNASLDPQV